MPRLQLFSASAIALVLALQTTFASPTPSNQLAGDGVMVKRDEYVYGARIAADNEEPPPGTQFPKRQDDTSEDDMSDVEARQLAPASISSTDGKYIMGTSLCDQDKDITKYFLFSSDLSSHAKDVCERALGGPGADGTSETLPAINAAPYTGSKVIKARVKVAATIWHRGSVRVEAQMQNLGMGTDARSKGEATAICIDAVNYIAGTCHNGIGGTSGSSIHYSLEHEATKGGSVTWNDKNGKPQISFGISLVKN